MENKQCQWVIKDEREMLNFGAVLSTVCGGGEVIFLHGELGAGKTTLSRGFLQKMGHEGAVKSPTYTLVERYSYQQKTIYHFDLYRLGDGEELEYMGIRDYFHQNAICLIEWAEKGKDYLPKADIEIKIDYEQEDQRRVYLSSNNERGKPLFDRLNGLLSAS